MAQAGTSLVTIRLDLVAAVLRTVGPSGFRDREAIHGITTRKWNPMKSNGICGIGDFLGVFNASTHRPKIYYSLFHP